MNMSITINFFMQENPMAGTMDQDGNSAELVKLGEDYEVILSDGESWTFKKGNIVSFLNVHDSPSLRITS